MDIKLTVEIPPLAPDILMFNLKCWITWGVVRVTIIGC